MRLTACFLAASLAMLAGCTTTGAPSATTVPPATTTARAVSKPQSCIELTRIREAKVIDDQTIDFVMRGGETLRNTLPYKCPQLGFEKAFSYATSISRLCSVDIITVILQGGGVRTGASCGLGEFVPYTPVPPAK